MPGFLEVYGYYDPQTKAWGIDVSEHPQKLIQKVETDFNIKANGSATHLIADDDWNVRFISPGRTFQQLVRKEKRPLGRCAPEFHRYCNYARHDKPRRTILFSPSARFVSIKSSVVQQTDC